MFRQSAPLLLVLFASSQLACASEIRSSQACKNLETTVWALSNDAMEGRDTGSQGERAAAALLAARLTEAGLDTVPGSDDFRLPFSLYRTGWNRSETDLVFSRDGFEKRLEIGMDFRPFPFSDTGEVEAEVVFAGYGISAPELGYDDYVGLDVEGKIVFVLRHVPNEGSSEGPFAGDSAGQHAYFTAKAEAAQERGAVAMLLVTDPLHHEGPEDLRALGRLSLTSGDREQDEHEDERFLALQLSGDAAGMLLHGTGYELVELQRAVDAGTAPRELVIGGSARIRITPMSSSEEVATANIVGVVLGSDKKLADEWVVVGAHYDHIGAFAGAGGDTVFNGADDNASGSAGVLALAEHFAGLEVAPRRTLAFAFFTGEEKGLLGSEAMVDKGQIPVDKTVFMVNLDMIGRNNGSINISGDGFARGLDSIIAAANQGPDLDLQLSGTAHSARSDHHNFYANDIPYMMIFTGLHQDYHQLGDHADKIDFKRMCKIVDLTRSVVDEVANAATAPGFIHRISWLGVAAEVDGERAVITSVDGESQAAERGFAVGDEVVSVAGRPLESAKRIGRSLRAVDPGTEAVIGIKRGGEMLEVAVTRTAPGYMGIYLQPVPEEQRRASGLSPDQGIKVGGLTESGPSAEAGLAEGDIVHTIGGNPVGMSSLAGVLARIGAGETVSVGFIRDGEQLELELTLGRRPER